MAKTRIRISLHLLILSVLLSIAYGALQSPDLVTELRDATGRWSLYLLLVSLSFTPVTRFQPTWQTYVPLRRIVGLWAFTFASVHVLVWIVMEFNFDWLGMLNEILGNLFIWLGLLSIAFLKLLAATSNRAAVRWRGYGFWRWLHTLIYPATGLALGHYFMAQKLPEWQPLLLIGIFLLLSIWRWLYAD